jgi:hypothetical protein
MGGGAQTSSSCDASMASMALNMAPERATWLERDLATSA